MQNKAVRQWREDLKSGRYNQASGRLHRVNEFDKDEFCCLGVACDRAEKNGLIKSTLGMQGNKSYDDQSTVLPKSMMNILGLRTMDGKFRLTKAIRKLLFDITNINFYNLKDMTLVSLNDSYGLSFEEIERVIAANPPGLFKSKKVKKKR